MAGSRAVFRVDVSYQLVQNEVIPLILVFYCLCPGS